MFGFMKKMFVVAVTFFSCNVLCVYPLKCVSINNQCHKNKCQSI